jgi:hypothetical protein
MNFKSYQFLLLIPVFLFNISLINAAELDENEIDDITSAFRKYKDISEISIEVPTVVEVTFDNEFIERTDFTVFDNTNNSFEPSFFKLETLVDENPIEISSDSGHGSMQNMIDNNQKTYSEFILPESTQGTVEIVIQSDENIISSSLTMLLDNNVALPNTIEIRVNKNKIVLAKSEMTEQTVSFPETSANKWIIKLNYGQPLRISELHLNQGNVQKTNKQALRFLATPKHTYRIYYDSDRQVNVKTGESGNLKDDKEVMKISDTSSKNNPNFEISDIDNDGIPDITDNCISEINVDQADINNNGRGDVCDDFDKDGLINSKDNCPDNPNKNQIDTDSDKVGDVCDKEESRITEHYKWLPWVGIGSAGLVLVILFAVTAKSLIKK